jgi:antirestriction protein ArdC
MNVYEMVTERIIEQLEKGVIPWQKPWTGTKNGAYNRVSRKPYSILNQMLLQHSGEYATFKQWTEAGGHIRKGAKSEIVTFWKMQIVEEEKEDGTKVKKQIPLLRYYHVFHISQVDGVEPKEKIELQEIEPIETAERVKREYMDREHLKIYEKITDKAFYTPTFDYIEIPCKEQYTNIEEFYSTLFHEMIHSTGYYKRLNRLESGANAGFGSETYSKEELTAEIGSAMILNRIGIETEKSFNNSAAYIQNWLQVLKNDNKFIISASSRSEKAVKYIFNDNEVEE